MSAANVDNGDSGVGEFLLGGHPASDRGRGLGDEDADGEKLVLVGSARMRDYGMQHAHLIARGHEEADHPSSGTPHRASPTLGSEDSGGRGWSRV
jgi:hypothetical protein